MTTPRHTPKSSLGGTSTSSEEDVFFDALTEEEPLPPIPTEFQSQPQPRPPKQRPSSSGSEKLDSVYITPRESTSHFKYMNASGSFEEFPPHLTPNTFNEFLRNDNSLKEAAAVVNEVNEVYISESANSTAQTFETAIISPTPEVEVSNYNNKSQLQIDVSTGGTSTAIGINESLKVTQYIEEDAQVNQQEDEIENESIEEPAKITHLQFKSDQWFKNSEDATMTGQDNAMKSQRIKLAMNANIHDQPRNQLKLLQQNSIRKQLQKQSENRTSSPTQESDVVIEDEVSSSTNSGRGLKRTSKLSFLSLKRKSKMKEKPEKITEKFGETTEDHGEEAEEVEEGFDINSVSEKRTSKEEPFSSSQRNSKRASSKMAYTHPDDQDDDYLNLTLTTRNKVFLLIGTSFVFFLAVLDMNLLATQIPAIVSEFKSISNLSWLVTSYNLAATILQPHVGKFSTIFGRRVVFLSAIMCFGIGSILCGAAQNMTWLIISRAIAGLGGGVIISMAFIIISDVILQTLFDTIINGIFAITMIVGPILGGLLSQYATWRWSFLINGPLCLFSVVILFFALKNSRPEPPTIGYGSKRSMLLAKLERVDWLGTLLLTLGIIFILIPLDYGGTSKLDWVSVPILAMFGIGFILLVGFVFLEARFSVEPIIPPSYFKDHGLRAVFGAFFFTGWVQVVISYYTPIFYQYVRDKSPMQSAIAILPFVISLVVTLAISDVIAHYSGRYRWLIVTGSVFSVVGVGLQSTFDNPVDNPREISSLILSGIGIGLMMRILPISGQTAVKLKQQQFELENGSSRSNSRNQDLESPRSPHSQSNVKNQRRKSGANTKSTTIIVLCNLFRSIGLVLGMSISGMSFNQSVIEDVQGAPANVLMVNNQNLTTLNEILGSTKSVYQLSEDGQTLILNSLADAISQNFTVCVVMASVGSVFALFAKGSTR